MSGKKMMRNGKMMKMKVMKNNFAFLEFFSTFAVDNKK
jgi:hypothetical protein